MKKLSNKISNICTDNSIWSHHSTQINIVFISFFLIYVISL